MANVIGKAFWDKTGVNKFSKMLDVVGFRHKLIAGNIANSTTPGYTARDIDFQKEMKKALGSDQIIRMTTTSAGHIGNSGPGIRPEILEHAAENESELNGVDIDKEITNMAVNQMRYTIGARILQKKMSFIRKAIKGR